MGGLFTNATFSKIYGQFQDNSSSAKKVRPFVEKFNLDMGQYQPGSVPASDIRDSYASFNEFFIRKFKTGQRPFVNEPNKMAAFAEFVMLVFLRLMKKKNTQSKVITSSAKDLVGNDQIAKIFDGGPLMIARLCPVDYHRYHYPDNGTVIDHYPIHGAFDSVNPFALKFKNEIFIKNERYVTILQTENFGRIAYIEVGAICVGKIVQSHEWKKPFLRGEEKGYFLFGGSTVVILGEKGLWKPSQDILDNTSKGIETYLHLGEKSQLNRNFANNREMIRWIFP